MRIPSYEACQVTLLVVNYCNLPIPLPLPFNERWNVASIGRGNAAGLSLVIFSRPYASVTNSDYGTVVFRILPADHRQNNSYQSSPCEHYKGSRRRGESGILFVAVAGVLVEGARRGTLGT